MKKLGFAAIVIVLIIFGMRNRNRPETALPPEPSSQLKPEINEISITPKIASASATAELPAPVEKSVQNQPNSGAFAKKMAEGGFEPGPASAKTAMAFLESRKAENPSDEMSGMHPPDTDAGEGRMLLGKFMDEAAGIELITMLLPDDGVEHVCFRTPEVLFKASFGTYTLRSDASGYGIVKFNDVDYLRIIWSFDEKRIIHGQLLKIESGQTAVIKSFAAVEINRSSSVKFKYCK
jgi:hypothetical protein